MTPIRWPRAAAAGVLVVLAALIAAERLHTYDEPLERDITTYAVIGHELLAGRRLYSDLWDHKPPAVHATFAAAEALVGYGAQEVYLVNVLAGVATLLGVFAAARAGGCGRGMALWAAAFWAVISGDARSWANQPNTEVFLNACLIWALAAMLAMRGDARDGARVVSAGCLFALASLYKPVAVAVAAPLALVHVAWPPGERPDRRRALLQAVALAVPGALAWIGTLAWFGLSGRLGDFTAAVFAFNRFYAGDTVANLGHGLEPGELLGGALIGAVPLAVAAVGLLAAARARRFGRTALLALAYAIGTFAAVALPGQFWPHYFQLWLPLVAVAGGLGIAALQEAAVPRRPWLGRAAAAALLAILVAQQAPSYGRSADAWSERKYGTRFVVWRERARAVDAVLAPGETFYEWGAETGLYFYSQRRPPTGVFYNYPLRFGPLVRALSARTVRDLAAHPPELVLIPLGEPAPMGHPVLDWIAQRYAPVEVPGVGPDVEALARVGGALQARSRRAAPPRGGEPGSPLPRG